MLKVDALSKQYETPGGLLPILSDVSFMKDAGEALCIMGPSGSGKSTLLHILGTLDPPTAGTVTLGGRDPFQLSEPELAAFRNREVGFVFQTCNLLPHLTARENVAVPLLVRGLHFDQAQRRAEKLLADVGLPDKGDSLPAQLSGGQAQRVALARALSTEPKLLLGDEVTGNLDSVTGREMLNLIREQVTQRGLTAVVVTHDPMVSDWADRALVLKDGRLVA